MHCPNARHTLPIDKQTINKINNLITCTKHISNRSLTCSSTVITAGWSHDKNSILSSYKYPKEKIYQLNWIQQLCSMPEKKASIIVKTNFQSNTKSIRNYKKNSSIDIWNRVVPKNNLKQVKINHEVNIVAHWVAYFLKNCYKVRKGNLETSEQLILGVSHLSSASQQR